jgi:hypothetical protein
MLETAYMEHFQFIAKTRKGIDVRGELDAIDIHDLAYHLEEDGLFLVSAHAAHESLTSRTETRPAPTPEISPASSASIWEFIKHAITNRRARLTLEGFCILIGLMLLVILRPSPLVIPTNEVAQQVEQVRTGMTRGEVERRFIRYCDGNSSSLTHYLIANQIVMGVPFDKTGGTWSPKNRVTGRPTIYTQFKLVGKSLVPEQP